MGLKLAGVCPLLGVYDMPAAVKFYRDLLGFEIANCSPVLPEGYSHWVLLRLGDAELMLNTNFESNEERPSTPDEVRNKAHGDACLYFACPDVDSAYEHLRARVPNVKPPQVTHYGMKQMYLSDPDGYLLCFQWPAEPLSLAP